MRDFGVRLNDSLRSGIQPEEIYKAIVEGPGADSLDQAKAALLRQKDLHKQIGDLVRDQVTEFEQAADSGSWRGNAAQTAQSASKPLVAMVASVEEELAKSADLHDQQVNMFHHVRYQLTPMGDDPGDPNAFEKVFSAFSDHDEHLGAYLAAGKNNIQVYNSYEATSIANGDGLPPAFANADDSTRTYRQVSAPSSDVAQSQRNVSSLTQNTPKTGHNPQPVQHHSISDQAESHSPSVEPSTMEQPQNPLTSDETSAAGYVPEIFDTPAGLSGNGNQLPLQSGTSGPGSSGLGSSGLGLPGSNSWGANLESQSPTGDGFGQGRRVGASTPVAGGKSSATSNAANSRGTNGASATGAPGAVGAKDSDRERKRPSYLQEANPYDIFVGDLPVTTKPVLGA